MSAVSFELVGTVDLRYMFGVGTAVLQEGVGNRFRRLCRAKASRHSSIALIAGGVEACVVLEMR